MTRGTLGANLKGMMRVVRTTLMLVMVVAVQGCGFLFKKPQPKKPAPRETPAMKHRAEAAEIRADAIKAIEALGGEALREKTLAKVRCDPSSTQRCSAHEKFKIPVLRFAVEAIIIADRIEHWAGEVRGSQIRDAAKEARDLAARAMAAVPAELEKAREKQAMADERSRQKAVRDAKEAAERKAVAAADKKCMPDLAACKRACDDGDLLMCVAYGGNQKDDAAGLAEAKPVLQKACDAGESVGCAYLKTVWPRKPNTRPEPSSSGSRWRQPWMTSPPGRHR